MDLEVTQGSVTEGVFTDGLNVYLYPVPSVDSTLAISYYKRSSTKVSEDPGLDWLKEFPFVLINATVYNICRKHLRDKEGMEIAQQDLVNSLRTYHVKVEERKINMQDVSLGGRV
jgi:hypothetical protein